MFSLFNSLISDDDGFSATEGLVVLGFITIIGFVVFRLMNMNPAESESLYPGFWASFNYFGESISSTVSQFIA